MPDSIIWNEAVLLNEDFETLSISVKYGTGKLYGAGWLYGGQIVQDWLRPELLDQIPALVTEDFEDPNWSPPVWVENLLSLDDFENADWLRPVWVDSLLLTEDFEDANWIGPVWIEGLLLTDDFEDATW